MLCSFQQSAFFKAKKIVKVILCVLARDFLQNWEMRAAVNLLGFGFSQPMGGPRRIFAYFLAGEKV